MTFRIVWRSVPVLLLTIQISCHEYQESNDISGFGLGDLIGKYLYRRIEKVGRIDVVCYGVFALRAVMNLGTSATN